MGEQALIGSVHQLVDRRRTSAGSGVVIAGIRPGTGLAGAVLRQVVEFRGEVEIPRPLRGIGSVLRPGQIPEGRVDVWPVEACVPEGGGAVLSSLSPCGCVGIWNVRPSAKD